jgi:alanyl-tRNA synthetase
VVENNPSGQRLSFVQVWEKVVDVLEPRGYTPIKRYPVVARWNPTVEFTIASIAAFQPYVIAGEVAPPAKMLTIPQFCLRFGDIENVGITGSHCTGFVMIGQHVFVSPEEWEQARYFQDIYDFLIDGVGLSPTEVTIHEDAWAGGGNFGPCMEFFSRGVELFNQVYMMFQQTPQGPQELPIKVLDMGLGQERVAWFSQGTPNIYEAIFPQVLAKLRERAAIDWDLDFFSRFSQYSAFLNIDEVDDILQAWTNVAAKIGIPVEELRERVLPMTGIYSIAEHARALLFAINDGKLPSNVGGGYNLRVIFRRAMDFIDRFGWDIDMADVCEWHAEELLPLFPEVSEHQPEVRAVLAVEREKFFESKAQAAKILDNHLKKGKTIDVEQLILWYDSYGINPNIVKEVAAAQQVSVSIPDNFYQLVVERHETRVQAHQTHKTLDIDDTNLPATECLYFGNYLDLTTEATVQLVAPVEYQVSDEEEGSSGTRSGFAVVLDRTPAYPTSGGQLHDVGTIQGQPFVDVLKQGACVAHILL